MSFRASPSCLARSPSGTFDNPIVITDEGHTIQRGLLQGCPRYRAGVRIWDRITGTVCDLTYESLVATIAIANQHRDRMDYRDGLHATPASPAVVRLDHLIANMQREKKRRVCLMLGIV